MQAIVDQLRVEPRTSLRSLSTMVTRRFHIYVSHVTIRSFIREVGFRLKVVPRFISLTAEHRLARYRFAIHFREWREQDWMRVVFCDEKMWRLSPIGPRTLAWVEGAVPEGLVLRGDLRGPGLMVWGCISVFGLAHSFASLGE